MLIVDDNEALARSCQATLERGNFEVVVAPTLSSARRAVDEGELDALVLDIELPDGNGFDLVREPGCTPMFRW